MFLKERSISQILSLLVLFFKNCNIYQEVCLDDLEDNEKKPVFLWCYIGLWNISIGRIYIVFYCEAYI